ncbi:hypothetical protein [Faecalibacterium sp. OF04-11AC]|uniref:hypothetical protein n=1 Tax=Faecalibacterium sp. OF04-11AC TaxID=2293109 RepID=UPI001FA8FDE3|nr:hypothetical protein [Faecalibacterium sp. OF04-11AC]
MNNTLKTSLVLCDLDHLLLGTDGNLPQVLRDVMQLFSSRGGRLTVFSQRSPKAVRTILGSVRLAAPALVCGGTLAYQFATGTGQPLCSFAGREEAVLQKLPSAVGLGIALQMTDGSTRVLRMSEALEAHLRQEWTPMSSAVLPMCGARMCCASCSIRTKSRCRWFLCWIRHWGRQPILCWRSVLRRICWC